MPNPAPQIDRRIVDLLVSTGRLSEEQERELGVAAIMERLERVLNQDQRSDFLSPDRRTGRLLEAWRVEAELTQQELRTLMNKEFTKVGAIGIHVSNQSAVSRIVWGKQTLTYNQGMAALRVFRAITGKPIPGDFLSAWDGESVSGHFLPNLAEFSLEGD